jgi:hypothetical protein
MSFISKDELRARFCTALSVMYRTEVPLYGDLIELVDDVNATFPGTPEGRPCASSSSPQTASRSSATARSASASRTSCR